MQPWESCCRYLGKIGDKWDCLKIEPEMRDFLDRRSGMADKPDNCDGPLRLEFITDWGRWKAGQIVHDHVGMMLARVEGCCAVTEECGKMPYIEIPKEVLRKLPHEGRGGGDG